MKVILTKIIVAGEEGRIDQHSKEVADAEGGWKVKKVEEKAKDLFDDGIEGYKFFQNGFELSKFFELRDLDKESDTIYLDLFKEEYEDNVPRDDVSAENTTQEKYYIICNVAGQQDGQKPRPVRFPVGTRGKRLQLFPFAKDNGGGKEFRFGICKRSDQVYKDEEGTWYYYQLYKFDKDERYKNCKVTIGEDAVALKAGDKVMLTLQPVPLDDGTLPPGHFQPKNGGSAEDHQSYLRRFLEAAGFGLLRGGATSIGEWAMEWLLPFICE